MLAEKKYYNWIFIFLIKVFFTTVILFSLPFIAMAQNPYFGLYCGHYLQSGGTKGELKRIEKPIFIVYNSEYCILHKPSGEVVSFSVSNYSKKIDIESKQVFETFSNDYTLGYSAGFYMIMISRSNSGSYFNVSMPGSTFVVDKAENYSENGKIKTGSLVINWNDLKREFKRNDSLLNLKRKKETESFKLLEEQKNSGSKFRDSLIEVAKSYGIGFTVINSIDPPNSWIKSSIESRDVQLNSGANLNSSNLYPFLEELKEILKIEPTDYFVSIIKFHIDKKGKITEVSSDGSIKKQYLDIVSQFMIGQQITPFIFLPNGKAYPSFIENTFASTQSGLTIH